jgi:hypothetical protein
MLQLLIFAFVKSAFRKLAPVKMELLKSRPVNIPPDKFTLGPKMYPLRMKYDAVGRIAGLTAELISPLLAILECGVFQKSAR